MDTMVQKIETACFQASESELLFGLGDFSNGEFSSFSAKVTGPRCAYARTLPSTFIVPECVCVPDASAMAQSRILDPCYWTPRLPYLYDLEIEIRCRNDSEYSFRHTLGLRRWEVSGSNLLLERKRTVLRGVALAAESDVDLSALHDAEMAVIVSNPSEKFLQEASEVGVMVIADCRGSDRPLTQRLLGFSWQPSVALVVPEIDACYVPYSQLLSKYVTTVGDFSPSLQSADWLKAIIVELEHGESLPSAFSKLNKPIIAVRRGVEFSDMCQARAACDRLQADLAPEFDLAGYFVAP